jgi:phenylacetate-CoA ligase
MRTTTSGSTGTPVVTVKTALAGEFYEAATWREALWHRRDFSKKFGVIKSSRLLKQEAGEASGADTWGRPYSRLFGTGPAAAFDIFADPMRQIQWLIDEKPDYLLSMPSNLRALAELIQANAIAVPPLLEVRSYGEAVDDDLPRLCHEVWGAKHTTVYSTQEVGIIASQCPDHAHLHCDSELTLTEVVDDSGRPCGPGEVGRVVVTPLHNLAMPLIRYAIGDLAEVGAPCPCGRGLPVLTRVLGRTRGLLSLPAGGKRYVGSVGEIFGKISAIVQRQIIQKTLHDIDVLLVARRELNAEEEARLRAGLVRRLGDGFNFRIAYVESVPRNIDGKFEDFRSELTA